MIGAPSRLTELPTFDASLEKLCHRRLRPSKAGRGGAHFSFGFNLAQFGGL